MVLRLIPSPLGFTQLGVPSAQRHAGRQGDGLVWARAAGRAPRGPRSRSPSPSLAKQNPRPKGCQVRTTKAPEVNRVNPSGQTLCVLTWSLSTVGPCRVRGVWPRRVPQEVPPRTSVVLLP